MVEDGGVMQTISDDEIYSKTLVLTLPNLHIKDGDIIKFNPVMRTDVPPVSGPLSGCSRFTATFR